MANIGMGFYKVPKVAKKSGRRCGTCGSTYFSSRECPYCLENKMSFMEKIDRVRTEEENQKLKEEYAAYKRNQVQIYDKPRSTEKPLLGRLKCAIGLHKPKRIESSEARNHQLREMGIPLRASMAGWNKYRCERCAKEWTKVWTAF